MLKKYGFGPLFESAEGGESGASAFSVSGVEESQTESTDFRKVTMAAVLATDMGGHFPIVAKLQEAARRVDSRTRDLAEVEEDRLLICSCLMKCADISNPVRSLSPSRFRLAWVGLTCAQSRPHEVARAWSTCLLEEWAEQARIEAEFKLPISVVMLNPAEKRAQAKSQVGFINLFTQPLFDSMAALCPGAFALSLSDLLSQS